MAVVSLSRQFGAGGRTLGEMVAERLGYTFLHEFDLDRLAHQVDQVTEHGATGGSQLLDLLHTLGPTDVLAHYKKPPDPVKDFDTKYHVQALTLVIRDLADRGGTVLLGRGSPFVLRHHPYALRVLLVSQEPDREKFLIQRYSLDVSTARSMIKKADVRRRKLLSQFYPGEPDEASLYHLVLNTSLLSLEVACKQICTLLERLQLQEA